MTDTKKLSVFLCHSPADKAAIRDLYNRLLKYSWISPWVDEKNLLPGHDRNMEIQKALETADVVIIGLSKESITKEGQTQAEFKYALNIALEKLESSIFIIPLDLEELKNVEKQIPRKLKNLQREVYFPNKRRATSFEKILQSLKTRASSLDIPYKDDKIVTSPKLDKNKYSKENKAKAKGIISPATFPIHEIPFRKNPNFTGREDILTSIHNDFTNPQNIVPIHSLRGMGGIGKTQTAIYYSYEFAKEYDLVYWIRSETEASLTADYESLTQALQLPVKTKAEKLVYVNIVNNWLETTDKKWLLVFDNVESQADIEKILPRKGNGNILITSQNPNWKELGQDSAVQPFSNEIARKFFEKRIGKKGLEHSDKLNELLGGLPLALEQASAYMSTNGTPLETYIKLFEEQQSELWKREAPPRDYKSTILTTWEMAFKQIQESQPVAKQMLNLFSFFGPDSIPISMVKNYSEHLLENLKEVVNNPIKLEENLSAIHQYSLAERNGDFISFHRLVQDVIRTQLPREQRTKWAGVALQIMKDAFIYDEDDIETWASCGQLLPHALAIAGYAERYNIGLKETATIYQRTGQYFLGQAAYEKASNSFRFAIIIWEEISEIDHENLAISLTYLAIVRHGQANFVDATNLYNRALDILNTKETKSTARNLYSLGSLIHDQGDFENARKLYEQALTIQRKVLGEIHPDIAIGLGHIGSLFQDEGDFENAKKLYEQALTIQRTALGEGHPAIAIALNNLGSALQSEGDFESARKLYEQALTIQRTVLGESHPYIAVALNNLGSALQGEGDFENARKLYEQALAIRRAIFGEDHPDMSNSLMCIGVLLAKQSKYTESRQYMEQALSIYEKTYGPKHHGLITILVNLATVMFHLKQFPSARDYAQRAIKICSEAKVAKVKYRECEEIKQLYKSIPLIGRKTKKKKG